jgi:gliding motility-associated-like protein
MANSTGQYRVDVSNECGTNSATIRLYNGACKIYVPTAFTPNGDGNNDLFKAEFGENVIKFQLEVFNRWGQRVFNSNDFKKGWDGRIQGLLQPTGVYAWKITYTIYNEPSVKIMKGTTTLIN